MSNVLILGAGYVGQSLFKHTYKDKHTYHIHSRRTLDYSDQIALRKFILNNDITSIFTSLLFLLFSFFILYIFKCRKKIFYNFFFNIYTIGLFWIAISTFYRLYLNDFLQNTLDPNNFYKYSTISFDNISFIDICRCVMPIFIYSKRSKLTQQ